MEILKKMNVKIENLEISDRNINVYTGDIFDYDEQVDYLVISTFPNDYSKTSGSLIKAIYDKTGIDVKNLSIDRDSSFNYPNDLKCWISKPVSLFNKNKTRLLCLELQNMSTDAELYISHVFESLKVFIEDKEEKQRDIEVMIPMICTGSGKADINQVFFQLFYESLNLLSISNTQFKTVNLVIHNEVKEKEVIPNLINYIRSYNTFLEKAKSSKISDQLNESQIYSIQDYSRNGYIMLNRIMRNYGVNFKTYTELESENKHLVDEIFILKSALESLPSFSGITKRGEDNQNYTDGKLYLKGFTSTSIDNPFNNSSMVYFHGKKGKNIESFSHFPDEKEVLYAPTFVNVRRISQSEYEFSQLIFNKNFTLE